LKCQKEQKALDENIQTTMELPTSDTFWNQIYCVYCKQEGHLLANY
jgi:N-acetylneuraminic acid mutarotase